MRQRETAVLYRFNAFNKVYTRESYSAKAKWLPNKVRNLHGYELELIFLRGTTQPKGRSMMNNMSQTMKFTAKLTGLQLDHRDKFRCRKEESTGKLSELFVNKI